MARRVLRAASVALAGGAGVGLVLGGLYMWNAIEGWNRTGLSGFLAGWAVVVWVVCSLVAALARWTWRTTFKRAAIALTIAGLEAMYLAAQYLGHDFTPWTSIALATVAVLVLTPTAAAYLLWRREARTSAGSSSGNR